MIVVSATVGSVSTISEHVKRWDLDLLGRFHAFSKDGPGNFILSKIIQKLGLSQRLNSNILYKVLGTRRIDFLQHIAGVNHVISESQKIGWGIYFLQSYIESKCVITFSTMQNVMKLCLNFLLLF